MTILEKAKTLHKIILSLGLDKEAADTFKIVKIAESIDYMQELHIKGKGYEKLQVMVGSKSLSSEKIVMPSGDIYLVSEKDAIGSLASSKELNLNNQYYFPAYKEKNHNLELERRESSKNMAIDYKDISSRTSTNSYDFGKRRHAETGNDLFLGGSVISQEVVDSAIYGIKDSLELYLEAAKKEEEYILSALKDESRIFKPNPDGKNINFSNKDVQEYYNEHHMVLKRLKRDISEMKSHLKSLTELDNKDPRVAEALNFCVRIKEMRKGHLGSGEYVYQVSSMQDKSNNSLHSSRASIMIDIGCGWFALGAGINTSKDPVLFYSKKFTANDKIYQTKNIKIAILKKDEITNPMYDKVKELDGCDIKKEYDYQKNKPKKREGEIPEYSYPERSRRVEDIDTLSYSDFVKLKDDTVNMNLDEFEAQEANSKKNKTIPWCERFPNHPTCRE